MKVVGKMREMTFMCCEFPVHLKVYISYTRYTQRVERSKYEAILYVTIKRTCSIAIVYLELRNNVKNCIPKAIE